MDFLHPHLQFKLEVNLSGLSNKLLVHAKLTDEITAPIVIWGRAEAKYTRTVSCFSQVDCDQPLDEGKANRFILHGLVPEECPFALKWHNGVYHFKTPKAEGYRTAHIPVSESPSQLAFASLKVSLQTSLAATEQNHSRVKSLAQESTRVCIWAIHRLSESLQECQTLFHLYRNKSTTDTGLMVDNFLGFAAVEYRVWRLHLLARVISEILHLPTVQERIAVKVQPGSEDYSRRIWFIKHGCESFAKILTTLATDGSILDISCKSERTSKEAIAKILSLNLSAQTVRVIIKAITSGVLPIQSPQQPSELLSSIVNGILPRRELKEGYLQANCDLETCIKRIPTVSRLAKQICELRYPLLSEQSLILYNTFCYFAYKNFLVVVNSSGVHLYSRSSAIAYCSHPIPNKTYAASLLAIDKYKDNIYLSLQKGYSSNCTIYTLKVQVTKNQHSRRTSSTKEAILDYSLHLQAVQAIPAPCSMISMSVDRQHILIGYIHKGDCYFYFQLCSSEGWVEIKSEEFYCLKDFGEFCRFSCGVIQSESQFSLILSKQYIIFNAKDKCFGQESHPREYVLAYLSIKDLTSWHPPYSAPRLTEVQPQVQRQYQSRCLLSTKVQVKNNTGILTVTTHPLTISLFLPPRNILLPISTTLSSIFSNPTIAISHYDRIIAHVLDTENMVVKHCTLKLE